MHVGLSATNGSMDYDALLEWIKESGYKKTSTVCANSGGFAGITDILLDLSDPQKQENGWSGEK